MDDESMNRYEKQLYTVFKTFDVDNEEALNRSAVHELCDALQLEDRGATLVNTLFERRSDRVTFAQFRNGLLAVLGGAGGDHAPPAGAAPATPLQPDPPPQQSDDDSSGREVAPKFIFGSKKYGRRSRPPRDSAAAEEPPSPRSSSASRLDTDDKTRARQRMRCRRSVSAMESRYDSGIVESETDGGSHSEPVEHDRRIDRDEALVLCRDLHMDGIDRGLVERIFEDAGTADTTVGEFFQRLNASLTTTMEESSREARAPAIGDNGGGEPGDDEGAGVPSELVLEAWERAGVARPRRLLIELGFGAPALRPPELERALDHELLALPDAPDESGARALLLAAALALSRLRHERARRRAELVAAERDKLRADVVEANRRARLLAQEVDESHARIESELKVNTRRAEQRQVEATRQAAAEIAAERERAAAAAARLEAEVARRGEAEARARQAAEAARAGADELETRLSAAEERASAAERECARLAGELRAALERGAAAARQGEDAALATLVTSLRRDNERLRDRNDELCCALEAAGRAPPAGPAAPSADLSAELDSMLPRDEPEECDSSPTSVDQSISGQIESVKSTREVLESLDAVPCVDGVACKSCGARRQREAAGAPDAPDALRKELLDAERRHEEEKQKLTNLVKDLEVSLEQMRAEYDKCEEYWSGKLAEERDAFADEQRLGDERLAELVAKIGDYERQFARAPLPTIDERLGLEAQVTDLQDEFAAYRRARDAELQAARDHAARLAERLAALERRPPPPAPAPAPHPAPAEVRELRARCGRAESALRRLHARLQAADALVKDLYVENCQLAHRRAL